MSQTPCISEYFSNLSQSGISTTWLAVEDLGGGVLQIKAERPFYPIQGILDTGAICPAVNQKNFNATFATFFVLMSECYLSSVNFTEGISSYPRILPGTYDQYLYKKLYAKPEAENRFFFMEYLVKNYWEACDLGLTANEQFESIEKFKKLIVDTCDRKYFVPAGTYQFDATTGFYPLWQLWRATENVFYIESLEIVSI